MDGKRIKRVKVTESYLEGYKLTISDVTETQDSLKTIRNPLSKKVKVRKRLKGKNRRRCKKSFWKKYFKKNVIPRETYISKVNTTSPRSLFKIFRKNRSSVNPTIINFLVKETKDTSTVTTHEPIPINSTVLKILLNKNKHFPTDDTEQKSILNPTILNLLLNQARNKANNRTISTTESEMFNPEVLKFLLNKASAKSSRETTASITPTEKLTKTKTIFKNISKYKSLKAQNEEENDNITEDNDYSIEEKNDEKDNKILFQGDSKESNQIENPNNILENLLTDPSEASKVSLSGASKKGDWTVSWNILFEKGMCTGKLSTTPKISAPKYDNAETSTKNIAKECKTYLEALGDAKNTEDQEIVITKKGTTDPLNYEKYKKFSKNRKGDKGEKGLNWMDRYNMHLEMLKKMNFNFSGNTEYDFLNINRAN